LHDLAALALHWVKMICPLSEPHDWDPRKIKQVCNDKHANAADEE
jgi:hypothetical protein